METVCTKINVTIRDSSLITDSLQVIKVVRPNWLATDIKHKEFTDGKMNRLVGYFIENNIKDVVMVKVYGFNTDLMIDRAEEIKTMQLLQRNQCGAELYAVFSNGICYAYIPGSTLTTDSCRDPQVFPLVAAELAKMHSNISISQQKPVSLIWNKMRDFNRLGQDIIRENITLRVKLAAFGVNLQWGSKSINELEQILTSKNIPITFCHNDLLLGNIIFDDEKSKVSFIDFEYSMPNYSPFDVANHFTEFGGIDDADFSKCPDSKFKKMWIAEYLSHLKTADNIRPEIFEYWVELCIPAAHLLWILWAIVQAQHSSIKFDFVGYVGLRVAEYEKLMHPIRKHELKTD